MRKPMRKPMRRPGRARALVPGLALGLAACAVSIATSSPARAQNSPAEAIRELDAQREAEARRAEELAAQAAAEQEAARQLQSALVQAAAAQRESEKRAAGIEARLGELEASEEVVLSRLQAEQVQLSELLGALIALEKQDAPALAISPEDAAAAVRAAILMGEAAPALRERAQALSRQLRALREVRESIEIERADLIDTEARLAERAERLEALLEERRVRAESLQLEASEAVERAAALGEEAESLRKLIEDLAAQAIANASRNLGAGTLSFARAKGLLLAPVTGRVMSGYGTAAIDSLARGVTYAVRSEAVVVAPFDGIVEFAQPFKDYGQLLILNVGEGHHLVLAGMQRLHVTPGQSVLAGEPVGAMGKLDAQAASELSADTLRRGAALYLEIRHNGAPVNPAPWLGDDAG